MKLEQVEKTVETPAKEALFITPREFRRSRVTLKDGERVAILFDLHIPFQNQAALSAVAEFLDDFKPNLEIYGGDILDFYSLSRFDQNPSRKFTLQDEIDEAKAWLLGRKKANPTARQIFMEGNHEDWLRKYLWTKGQPVASLTGMTVDALLGLSANGIDWHGYRSQIDLNGFLVEHGHRASVSAAFPSNVGRLMAIERGRSGCCGHDHRTQVYCWTDARDVHVWMMAGCLCQTTLEYAPFPNWQHGFVIGSVFNGKFFPSLIRIHHGGFVAQGKFYKVQK